MRLHRLAVVPTLVTLVSLVMALAGGACAEEAPREDGALVSVSLSAKVGVLLDEVPASMRDRAAAVYLARSPEFWLARVRKQLLYTRYRLVFRQSFFPDKMQLPLPPESTWVIELDEGGPRREQADGHDTIVIDYRFKSTLLSDLDSPARSEPALGVVGGVWDEPAVLPVDPELLLQRTGYACMDEYEVPPGSVDSENDFHFFDFDCAPEPADALICHTPGTMATESCREALDRGVGRVDLALRYERLAWDQGLADTVRVAEVTPGGADLRPRSDTLVGGRVTYRYIAPDDCAIAESCVGGPGYRRLLQFGASAHNLGDSALHIGDVDYFVAGEGTDLTDHHVYEYSACHDHYHFMHYGVFELDAGTRRIGGKRAFCLLSTERLSNNEQTPLNSPYQDCEYQGIERGWGDEYYAGLGCQWLDITDLDPEQAAQPTSLRFEINPDGFLCEGQPVTDADGEPKWEPTEFKTEHGEPVDRQVCEFIPDWRANNARAREVILPPDGGMVTQPCARDQPGPLRNCGLETLDAALPCTPGAEVSLSCTAARPDAAAFVRLCESSVALGAIPCTHADALANVVVDGSDVAVKFTCPTARDALEVGGLYGVHGGSVLPDDGSPQVTCVPAK